MSYMLDFDSGTKILQLAICGCCIVVGPLPLVYRLSRHPILESAPSWPCVSPRSLTSTCTRWCLVSSCRTSSHQNVGQNPSCRGSQFSGCRIARRSESVGRNNGTHLDVQRLRHTHEWSGTGRCERSSLHCGPTRIGQIEASGHQLLVDPRESSKGWPELQESGWCRQWSRSIHEDLVV